MSLDRLIAEAAVLAGGTHQCIQLGHVWKSIGGRPCPFHEHEGCGSGQEVLKCASCHDVDYGVSTGEPAFEYCKSRGFNCGGDAPTVGDDRG